MKAKKPDPIAALEIDVAELDRQFGVFGRQILEVVGALVKQVKRLEERLEKAEQPDPVQRGDMPPGPELVASIRAAGYDTQGLRSRDRNTYERLRRWERGDEAPTREGVEGVLAALGGTGAELPERHELPPAEEISA